MSTKTRQLRRLLGAGAAFAISAALLTGCMGNAAKTESGGAAASGGAATLAMPTEPATSTRS